MRKKTVELLPAYEWVCDECGKNNFASCVSLGSLLEVVQQKWDEIHPGSPLPSDINLPPGGVVTSSPKSVTCRHCGCDYGTDEVRQDEEY